MINKTIIFTIGFLLLAITNIFLINKITWKYYKDMATQKILDEIAKNYQPENQFFKSSAPLVLGEYTSSVNYADGRAANLKSFFRKHSSPLYDFAEHIVAVSDKYNFDYRLLPAIAMQESNLCKFIPDDSYNCWGWGIYGDKVTKFSSYDEAIDVVAAGLKEEYIDKGLVKASAIMEKYTPSSKGTWSHGVNTFLELLQ